MNSKDLLTVILDAIAEEMQNGFDIAQIQMNRETYEALTKLFCEQAGISLTGISYLYGFPVAINNQVHSFCLIKKEYLR